MQGNKDFYIRKIFIKFDENLVSDLNSFFKIPTFIGKGIGNGAKVRLPLGYPIELGYDEDFPAIKKISKEDINKLGKMINSAFGKYQVGWEDTYGETHWEAVDQAKEIKKADVM